VYVCVCSVYVLTSERCIARRRPINTHKRAAVMGEMGAGGGSD